MHDKAKIKSIAAPVLITIVFVVTVMIIAIAVERTNESNRLRQDQPGSISLDSVPVDVEKFVVTSPSPSPTASLQDIAERTFLKLTRVQGDNLSDSELLRLGWSTCIMLGDGFPLDEVITEITQLSRDAGASKAADIPGYALGSLCTI